MFVSYEYVFSAFLGFGAALLTLIIAQYFIEPKKWKRNTEYEHKKEKLIAYGRLLEILDHARARNDSWGTEHINKDTGEKHEHTLSVDDKKIFRKCTLQDYHYYSTEIRSLINHMIATDKLFQLEPRDTDSGFLSISATKLEEQVKKEYDVLKSSCF